MLTDAHSLQVIIAARDQKLKKGGFKMKEESREAITRFITFNAERDWMESKDYTKLGRILAAAVFTGSELVGQPLRSEDYGKMGVRLYNNITFLRPEQQWHLQEQPEHEVTRRVVALAPLVNAFESMKNRLTKNGKFPKEEAERIRREAIKGALDKKLYLVLDETKQEWAKIIYNYELAWLKDMGLSAMEFVVEINKLNADKVKLNDGQIGRLNFLRSQQVIDIKDKAYVVRSEQEYMRIAHRRASDESESFFFKMADKLGGLVTGKRPFINATRSSNSKTPFSSFLHFEFDSRTSFSIENKIITNRSPLNNYFYQYPCTFFDVVLDGNKLNNPSELMVKQAFLKEIGEIHQ